jgi:biotin synthase
MGIKYGKYNVMKNKPIGFDEALKLLETPDAEIMNLISRADKVRRDYFGNKVVACSIINAKSGNCGEDCKFCPQSVHSDSVIEKYPLLDTESIVTEAQNAEASRAHTFGIVTSGRSINQPDDQARIVNTVSAIANETGIGPCASLGTVDEKFLLQLKESGLISYHHNLEAAESFYPQICTSRTFKDNVETIKTAKRIGLGVCSGGLFGMGESLQQRVELFETLRELEVDSVPVNFLNPVDGTPLKAGNPPKLTPFDCLRIIAVARLMMPTTTIRVCGGREYNLRDMQSWIFAAGANAMMVGCYLTTKGREVADDMQMIKDAGMELE